MKTSEMILLVGLAGFAGWLLWESTAMPYHTGIGVGAGFVPLNIAVTSLTLIAVLTCKSSPVGEKREERRTNWQRVRPPVITMILLVMTVLVMGFGSVLLPLGGGLLLFRSCFSATLGLVRFFTLSALWRLFTLSLASG